MLFNSLKYGVFLPIVFGVYWVLPNKFRWILLLAASYYFYMSWNPKYVVLIFLTTIVSYLAALLVEKYEDKKHKKLILVTALIVCLGILFVFKYFNFFSETAVSILSIFSIRLNPVTLKLVLPVGISFYTFQTISYVIDVYRGDVKAERNFGIYATFISFFPQLVAGPIERTRNLLPQITSEKKFDYTSATYGLKLMAWGFFKKLVLADVTAGYVDTAFLTIESCTGLDLLAGLVFFSVQIYCDFSGYSDIAIGTARLFGIELMQNFRSPFFSTSVKELWTRWHISLSNWFRDYVYIPLGGSRCSRCRKHFNLLVTFLLSGLWHGANLTYVVWGGMNGLAQIIEEYIFGKKVLKGIRKFFSWIWVLVFWNITMIFFRAESISQALLYGGKLFGALRYPSQFRQTTLGLDKPDCMYCLFFMLVLFIFDYFSVKTDVIKWISEKKPVLKWTVYILLIWVILAFMPPVNTSEFVYFQF
ncbi:MAG: MBOAT family protein [Lachnospiraceae bacterium]|nr:MBOAT family protein [Lachnospiraceae bacterium]